MVRVAGEVIRHAVQVFNQALPRLFGKIDEDETLPLGAMDTFQPQAGFVQVGKTLLARDPAQRTVGIEGPGMKAAGKRMRSSMPQ